MIKFYLHTPQQDGWEDQCKDVLQRLIDADVVSSLDELNVCFNGNKLQAQPVAQPFLNAHKEVNLLIVFNTNTDGEMHSLRKLKDEADKATRDYIIGYTTLNGADVSKWAEGVAAIQSGYDLVVNGGFIWVTCDYVRRLPKQTTLKLNDWIYLKNPKTLDLNKE